MRNILMVALALFSVAVAWVHSDLKISPVLETEGDT